jgi:hypothetical protein
MLLREVNRLVNLKDGLREFAFSKGADLFGVASVDRFHGAPDGHKPTDILPEARTVVVCAKRIPESVVMQGPATSISSDDDRAY